jgi:hypothetical protein
VQVLPIEAHHNPKEDTLRRRLLLLVGLTMLGALLFASVALAQDYSSASASAPATPMATTSASATSTATATASGTATASAASAAGGSLPDTGGPTSRLVGIAALMLFAGAGVMSVAIVGRSS